MTGVTERVRFKFSIRTDATMPLEQVRSRVEAALGCSFHPGNFLGGLPAHLTNLLGMRIYLRQTVGLDDVPVFALHGIIDDARFFDAPDGEHVEYLHQDLSQGIIDVLEAFHAGRWHIPSDEEYEASGAAQGAYLDRIAGVSPGEGEGACGQG